MKQLFQKHIFKHPWRLAVLCALVCSIIFYFYARARFLTASAENEQALLVFKTYKNIQPFQAFMLKKGVFPETVFSSIAAPFSISSSSVQLSSSAGGVLYRVSYHSFPGGKVIPFLDGITSAGGLIQYFKAAPGGKEPTDINLELRVLVMD